TDILSDQQSDESHIMRTRVTNARIARTSRSHTFSLDHTIEQVSVKEIRESLRILPDGISVLEQAASQLNASGRGIHRTLMLARTIADLDQSNETKAPHILEALQYRRKKVFGND